MFQKRYIQYNDLVIDDYDMLSSADYNVDFKQTNYPLSFGDGAYYPQKSLSVWANPGSLAMTLFIDVKKVPCNERTLYYEHVKVELSKAGKMWCIQGDDLLWAFAYPVSTGEAYEINAGNTLSIDIDFVIPEGVWRVADTQAVFLKPYYHCDWNDCLEYQADNSCDYSCVGCSPTPQSKACQKCICECGYLNADNSYCNLWRDAHEKWYKTCGESYKIIYNCVAAKNVWGEYALFGESICSKSPDFGYISGRIYSHTTKDTNNVTIRIVGRVSNPIIEFNGNVIHIKGNYNGILTITPELDVYYQIDQGCEPNYLDFRDVIISQGSTNKWTAHHGYNSLFINAGVCTRQICAYVKIDAIRS